MKIIVKPKREDEVIAPTGSRATAELLRQSLVQQAQCCVNHLCGCTCSVSRAADLAPR